MEELSAYCISARSQRGRYRVSTGRKTFLVHCGKREGNAVHAGGTGEMDGETLPSKSFIKIKQTGKSQQISSCQRLEMKRPNCSGTIQYCQTLSVISIHVDRLVGENTHSYLYTMESLLSGHHWDLKFCPA